MCPWPCTAVKTGVYGIGDNDLGFISIGIYKPLYSKNQTPFLGGGLGVSFMNVPMEENGYNNYSSRRPTKRDYGGQNPDEPLLPVQNTSVGNMFLLYRSSLGLVLSQ